MPKLTSTTTSSRRNGLHDDKENSAPTMSSYLKRRKYEDEEEDEGEEITSLPKRSSSNRTAAKERNGSSSSSSKFRRAEEHDQVEPYEEPMMHSKRARRDVGKQAVQQEPDGVVLPLRSRKKEDIVRELEEVQAQFDELRELRMTEPERMLAEWRSSAEHKSKLAEEYIESLQRESARSVDQKAVSAKTVAPAVSGEDADERLYAVRRQLDELTRREAKMREENARLVREVEKARLQAGSSTSSAAFRARIGSGNMMPGSSEDERAVRRLYEDLTGLVVNKVEQTEPGRQEYRRFHAIFACEGYHDLEIKLEESTSDLPSILPGTSASNAAGKANGPRQDLVYTPTLDEDRDAELLQSGRLPSFLKDSIRFERATAVKFLSTLHKRLDRHSKR